MEHSFLTIAILKVFILLTLQENEKLKKECSEKTNKIEALNEKISSLLHKNQRYARLIL